MDQTPPFQPSFGMDFFAPIHIPHGLTFADHTDLPKRKASYADYPDHSYMDHSSLFHPQRDDEYTNEHFNALRADAKAWQPPQPHQPHGFLDASLEPWFGRDKDFGLDPFQICRSRGGSFNFGHLRRDSEDFFHMNSDFFRHIKNITEAKTPVIENNFRKKSFQVPDAGECYAENPYAFSNQLNHNFAVKAPEFTSTVPNHAQPTGLMATPQNTESTVDSAGEGSAKKRGRKKRMLNDKTECYDEAPVTKAAAKPGRPKKTKDNNEEESVPKTQLQKAKSLMVKNEACNIKQERDDKSTEISSSASKLEDSPNLKPKTDIMSEIMKLKAPENLKEILGGMNVPNEVKEFFQKTNWMGQTTSVESRKIGTLTVAERRVKIEKYLQKRKKRTWSRKINYDCRKRVADSRLRIKGRFVTREQAFALMDDANITYNPETITNAEIKVLLAEKFGGSILKKKSSENQSTSLCIKRPSDKELDEQDLDDGEDEGSELSE